MNKEICKLDINNLVATDGFHFSGSGLVNDIFKESGYVAPKNIRADELFYNSNNFSWPRALNNEYTFYKKFALTCRLVKTMLIRIPLNIIQKTFVYNKYLVLKGREVKLHQSTSVNRSLWSYLVSVYMVICRHSYNEDSFVKWLGLKYWWQIYSSKNLLLDNGIPRDKRIADWFFGINGSIGILVYRNPRIQYQQIAQVYKSTGKVTPSYDEFLSDLESQYQSINWILSSNYKFILISFDKLLNDINYRNQLEIYFKHMNILSEINYDFSESIKNNESLSSLSEKIVPSKKIIKAENVIRSWHELFERKSCDIIKATENK
jgi:hypothetical protein